MNTDLHKRLEEAAKESVNRQFNCTGKYACPNTDCEMCGGYNTPYDCCECTAGDYKEGFLAGAEYGYKEAIKAAKEWLGRQGQDWWEGYGIPFSLTDFETDMNKLLEKSSTRTERSLAGTHQARWTGSSTTCCGWLTSTQE